MSSNSFRGVATSEGGKFGFRLHGQYYLIPCKDKASSFLSDLHPEVYLILQKYSSLSVIIEKVGNLKKVSDVKFRFGSPQPYDIDALAKYSLHNSQTSTPSWYDLTFYCQNSFIRVLESGYLNTVFLSADECDQLDNKAVREYVFIWDLDDHKIWYSYLSDSPNTAQRDILLNCNDNDGEIEDDKDTIGSIDEESDDDVHASNHHPQQQTRIWNVKQVRIHEMISYYKYHTLTLTYDDFTNYSDARMRHFETMTSLLQYRIELLREFVENLELPLMKTGSNVPLSCQQSVELLENRLGIIKCYFRSLDEEEVYLKCYSEITWIKPPSTSKSHENIRKRQEREALQQSMKAYHILRANIKHHVPFNAKTLPQEYCKWKEDQVFLQLFRQQQKTYEAQLSNLAPEKRIETFHEVMIMKTNNEKQNKSFTAM